jgi:Zn finger protein HypA/HybF involved in hydrogenase expression
MNAYSGPPMTLGNAASAHVRLIVWCLDCRHRVEPDPVEMAERYGAEMSVPDWHSRLVCGKCGSRRVDMVVSGKTIEADCRTER